MITIIDKLRHKLSADQGTLCEQWDLALNIILDQYEPSSLTKCSVTLGPFCLWICNYPYAYGCIKSQIGSKQKLPSHTTRRRLKDVVNRARFLRGDVIAVDYARQIREFDEKN